MAPDRENIREFFKTNGGSIALFAISFLLAFAIWVLHSMSQSYSGMVSIAVTARSNLEGYASTSSNTAVISVRCRAIAFEFYRFHRTMAGKPLVLDIDPADLQPSGGEDEFVLSGDAITRNAQELLGGDMSIEAMLSDNLTFHFPKENSKKVPVHPNFSMTLMPQYINTGSLSMKPDSVTIYGEPYKLENIDRVHTQPFTLRDLRKSVSGEVSLEQPVKGVRLSDTKVTYSMEVVRYVEITATMPVTARNVPSGKRLVVYPGTAKVSFRCKFPVSVSPQNKVRFYIDYKDFSKSLAGQCLPRHDAMPSGVVGYTITPNVFECMESDR